MSGALNQLRKLAEAGFQSRERWLKRLGLWELPQSWGEEESLCLRYILGTLPLTDLGDYTAELFESFASHGLRVREEFSWCAALAPHSFLKDVLCPRVNTEELSDCRGLFYEQLKPRVQGLSLPEAILEVNRWCAENAAYRSTDLRTASALDVYSRKYGRCGEESVFAVNALRSVGIAARQVYAPWWSHCDDNHAWVEAWDGECWRFLGACEPEPHLDMGWFTAAAGRAMLCHTKAFVGEAAGWEQLFPGVSPLDLDLREGVVYESVTARYAKTRTFTLYVRGPEGEGVSGAVVEFYVLNEGVLRPIARRVTGKTGRTVLNLGLGSLWITVRKGGFLAEALVDTAKSLELTMSLPGSRVAQGEFDFHAPADAGLQSPALSQEEKVWRQQVLERAKAARESREVFRQEPEDAESVRRVLETLTDKDRAGTVSEKVWEESLEMLEAAKSLPSAAQDALISPRIGLEPLAPWRELLSGAGPGLPPEQLWEWLSQGFEKAESFSELPQTPAGAWRLGAANEQGLRALFCGLCRARGIPARLGVDGKPQVWRDGAFRSLDGLSPGRLNVARENNRAGGRLGLMRWEDGWQAMSLESPLPQGMYRLIAATRLPNGGQLAAFEDIPLSAGERQERTAVFREASRDELLQRLKLPELGFEVEEAALLCWVDPGAEPTEHLLGELRDHGPMGCAVHFFTDQPEKLSYTPEGAVLHPWDAGPAEAAARRMYLEPGVLPLVVLAEDGYGRYASAGYQVGLVELASGLAQEMKREQEAR